jgi:DNA polymerase III subunit delta'
MRFATVIGQQASAQTLSGMVDDNRLPHALLLAGPAGSGKRSLALALVQYVLCTQRSEGDSCGTCDSCNKVSKLLHPDVHFSFPVVGAGMTSDKYLAQWRQNWLENPHLDLNQWLQLIGAENKQGNINKDECLNIIRKLSLKSFEAPVKTLILWLPEYLGNEGNRLLKLIEEPPPQTQFILLAENTDLILQTILSRCQLVKIPALRDEEVVAGLVQKGLCTTSQAEGIAHLANGDFNEALQLAANKENDNAVLLLDWLRKCYKGSGPEMLKWSEKFAGIGRENQKHFLQYALHFLREFMLLKVVGDRAIRLRAEEAQTAHNLLKVLDVPQIERMAALFNDCFQYVERNANPKILFLDASIQLHKTMKRWDV